MYTDLRKKRVLVTGANQGLGKALAQAFVSAGCRVAALARQEVNLDQPAETETFEVLRCDIRNLLPVGEWLAGLESRGEGLDILVNNAGVMLKSDLIDCTPEDFDPHFEVNVRATFLLSQLAARHMKGRGGGAIVNVASYAATLPSVSHGAYAASKAAVVSLTRSMAAEWAPFGIRVNALSPGVILTRMTRPALEQNRARMLQDMSLNRLSTGEEIAEVALFLASDASACITGANVDASGGKLIVQNPGAAWS